MMSFDLEASVAARMAEWRAQEAAREEAARHDRERRQAEYKRELEERQAKLLETKQRLAELTDPLARTILDLHAEDEDGDCEGCDPGAYAESRASWPCSTIDAIAAYYQIALP